MKIGIISDLHRHHWTEKNLGSVQYHQVIDACEVEKPDFVVDAGDYETTDIHDRLEEMEIPVLRIPGNHDYYGTDWEQRDISKEVLMWGTKGVGVVGTTLWTDFDNENPNLMVKAPIVMNDYRQIKNFNPYRCLKTHKQQLEWLRDRLHLANVVVTHHGPSFRSVPYQYRTSNINGLFFSNLDDIIEKSNVSLWIHGHTHYPSDYKIGKTRVVCNPCGYPHERRDKPYEPQFITI